MSKFEEIYKKVLNADKKFKELGIPINLEFNIDDFRDALIESNDEIEKLKAENKRLEEIKDKYSNCAEKAINNIAKCELKIRSLSRALWLARAVRAHDAQHWGTYVEYVHFHENSFYEFDGDDIVHRDNKNFTDGFRMWCSKWTSVERKCREKAKVFE